ncbi:MAG TPA: hypothetical protein V6D22_25980 [Candidatus Obscuribacterales bacterium]
MKTALILAASFALTTTACLAEDCSKSSCEKKSSLISKLFHKKACDKKEAASKGEGVLPVAGTNFIIN